MIRILILVFVFYIPSDLKSFDMYLNDSLVNNRLINSLEVIEKDSVFQKIFQIESKSDYSYYVSDTINIINFIYARIQRFYNKSPIMKDANINLKLENEFFRNKETCIKFIPIEQFKITSNRFKLSVGFITNNIYLFSIKLNPLVKGNDKIYEITILYDGDIVVNYLSNELQISEHPININNQNEND